MRILGLAGLVFVAASSPSFAAGDPAAGQTVFAKCAVCHNVGAGAKNKIGPALTGIIGRQPGTFAGFSYSQPMKDFGGKNPAWTPELVGQFLKGPGDLVPGTKMTFSGLTAQGDIDNVIAYLQSQ
ncbi:MAG: cytochrome c family protein [Devosia sp.]|nr:cytochrome c family protein [Devosia sp.]